MGSGHSLGFLKVEHFNIKTRQGGSTLPVKMRINIASIVYVILAVYQTVHSDGRFVYKHDFQIEERIVGGKEVVVRIPHQVAIQILRNNETVDRPLCGGSLISEKYVLTGAQCLSGARDLTKFQVRVTAGGIFLNSNLTDGEMELARRVIIHPQWNNRSLENDIAIIETNPFDIIPEYLEPIRLPSKKQTTWSFWMWSATTSGWGKLRTDMGEDTKVLHSVESRILKNAFCQFKYSPEIVKDTNMCTSGSDIRGLCMGDEGGPLFVKERDQKFTLLGISSFKGFPGMICETSLPTVYTRVANEEYLQWISETTGIPRRA